MIRMGHGIVKYSVLFLNDLLDIDCVAQNSSIQTFQNVICDLSKIYLRSIYLTTMIKLISI